MTIQQFKTLEQEQKNIDNLNAEIEFNNLSIELGGLK